MLKNLNKFEHQELSEIFDENDFIFFTGTWSNNLVNLEKSGYKLFALHRTDKNARSKRDSGGLCCYIKQECCKHVVIYNRQ